MKFDFETQDFINTLQGMLQDYGRVILQDAKKCFALWLDYAPQLPEEGELLKLFLGLGLGEQITELKRSSETEREFWRRLAIKKMVEAGENEKDATSLVNAVMEALGWCVKRKEAVKPVVSPKPMESPKSVETLKPSLKSSKVMQKQQEVVKVEEEPVALTEIEKPAISTAKAIPHTFFGPEKKMIYLNKHLPKIIGYKIAIIPNNAENWESVSKYTTEFSRGFQTVCPLVTQLGIQDRDVVLGMIMEEDMLRHIVKALIFSDECIYQISKENSWRVTYREIERVELQNNVISLYKERGGIEKIMPFRMEYNTRELFSMIEELIKGERQRVWMILPNSQEIELPAKIEKTPYCVMPHGLQPGNALLCRISSKVRGDNYVKECTYIPKSRTLKVEGKNKNGTMLYVELAHECKGWIFASSVRRC